MKQLYIYIFLLLIAFSCSDRTEDDFILPKGRTVLVYIAGDGKPGPSNLSPEVAETQEALMEGWSSEIKGSLIVFADRNDSPPVLVRIGMHKNKIVADTLRTYSNENSASPELLRQVIEDTQLLAPGESYGLVLFSHASGWLPAGAFADPLGWEDRAKVTPRSIFEDQGREMEFADFIASIPSDMMFDFIASEMCFMSSVETAYALRNKTKYLLASAPEVLSPGFRPIYKTSLNMLFEPEANLEGFGQAFFDFFRLEYEHPYAAISLVRTSEMESLVTLTREIAPSLTQEQIDKVQYYDRKGKPHLFFDYGDYMKQKATSEQIARLEILLDKAVIFKRNTPKLINIDIIKHSGLSVYIPQDALFRLNKAYEETDWWKAIN